MNSTYVGVGGAAAPGTTSTYFNPTTPGKPAGGTQGGSGGIAPAPKGGGTTSVYLGAGGPVGGGAASVYFVAPGTGGVGGGNVPSNAGGYFSLPSAPVPANAPG